MEFKRHLLIINFVALKLYSSQKIALRVNFRSGMVFELKLQDRIFGTSYCDIDIPCKETRDQITIIIYLEMVT